MNVTPRRALGRALALAFLVPCAVGWMWAENGPQTPDTRAGGARADGSQAADPRPKNLVLLIADGFGPASLTLARDFRGEPLFLDGLLVGSCSTRSSDSPVTDSAAAATAFACGAKSYNGAIGVDADKEPLGTILEAAERRGMATGLVTTTTITHATPACFAAHVPSRAMTHMIAEQLLQQGIEVLVGGGTSDFLPREAGGGRGDGRDLLAEAAGAGYHVVRDRAGFEGASETPLLALFCPSMMEYEIDRDPALQPSLAEMTLRALELLEADEDGFFLMVEGGRIDHAAHGNDPAAHVRDILAYDAMVAALVERVGARGDTLVVSVADHETGGLSIGRNVGPVPVYSWRPERLEAVRASAGVIAREMIAAGEWRAVLETEAGIDNPTEKEAAALDAALAETGLRRTGAVTRAFLDLLNERALLGWSTGGHTAVDVHVFATGPGAERLRGYHTNDALGRLLAELLRLDYAQPTVTYLR